MPGQVGRYGAFAPLREPNFRWYFLSRSVNLVGNTMAPIALAFAVLEVSDSASSLGIVLAAHSIPMIVFLLAGGVIADRFGRALVIQTCNIAAALTQAAIAALVITGVAELWMLVTLTAVNGTVAATGMPAMSGFVPQLVPRDQLQPANVLLSLTRGALAVIGPTVAAALVVTAGPGWALAVDAATWLVAALLLLPVKIPARVPATAPTGATGAKGTQPTVLAELREGWQVFTGTTWLWVVVLSFSVMNAIHEGGLNTLGPVLAKQSSIGEHGWGLILSAQAVGLLVMTFLMMRFRLRRPLLVGMIGCAAFGVPMVVMGAHPHVVPVMVAALVAGMGIEVFSLGWNLAMQENIPEELLSRAYSYDALGSFVAIPVGQLAFGPLALVFGIQQVLLVGGVLYVVVALLTLTSRAVRTLPRASLVEPQPALG